jgi:integrase
MPRARLTDLLIRKQTVAKGRLEIWEKGFKGGSFGLRVTETGHKSFVVLYRVNDRLRRMTLGVYPALSLADARKAAIDAVARAARGEDPQAEKIQSRRIEKFSELGELYLEKHARIHKRPISVAEDERILKVYLYPSWRNRKISDIARRDVVDVLDDILHRRGSPVMPNRVRSLISKVFNFGLSRDLLPFNPAAGVPKPAREKSKETVLSDEQIKILWEGLENRAEPTASVFRLTLLSGRRPGEVRKIRWADIGDDAWRIPAEIAKNGREHLVPIFPQAQEVIDRLRTVTGEKEWVFATSSGEPVEWIHSMIKRVNKDIAAAEEEAAVEQGREPRNLRFTAHDLRRTAASGMGALGVSRDIIARVLNHKSSDNTVTAVYDRYDRLPEMRRALDRWGAHVEKILTGELARVVNFS